jgi:hypothetical protein
MMIINKTAGMIMGQLEAFDGSKPAIDSDRILIVRGRSKKRLKIEDMGAELDNVLERLDAINIDLFSDEATDIIGVMDEHIRNIEKINTETNLAGIHKMKDSFENMGCAVEYRLAKTNKLGIFLILWKDKSGIGPCFVEIVIADIQIE